MNAVLGIGRLLADTDLTLEQQQYVQMITNSGRLLLTIINGQRAGATPQARSLAATKHGWLHSLLDLLSPHVVPLPCCLLLSLRVDILDYSKIEAGRLTLNFSPHNLADVAEAAIMLCQSRCGGVGASSIGAVTRRHVLTHAVHRRLFCL